MKRKKVTFSLWLMAAAAHAAAGLVLSLIVLLLDINNVLNLLEFASGTLLVLLVGTPLFAYAWAGWYVERYNRRIPKNYCPCGYDLTGNVSGACPECGRPAEGLPNRNQE